MSINREKHNVDAYHDHGYYVIMMLSFCNFDY